MKRMGSILLAAHSGAIEKSVHGAHSFSDAWEDQFQEWSDQWFDEV